jgi:hypothetical protein
MIPVMDALLTPRARGTFLRAGAAAPLLIAFACSSAAKRPPALGNCVPEGDASCDESATGGAGVVFVADAAAAAAADAGATLSESEGGSCGVADTLLTRPCGPCVVASCCMADAICSSDDGCLTLLNCALNETACLPFTQASGNAFNDLAQCYQLNCPTQCQALGSRDF